MAYFPFFVELDGQEGLIVGGSTVAQRKIEKLLPYGSRLTVCAPDISRSIRAIPGLSLVERAFTPELLEGRAFVIAATDDPELNHHISRLCRERRVPVNVVDDRDYCSFLFPALVKRGSLSVGISTGGASPTGAIYLKKQIDAMIPERFGELLDWLDSTRGWAKEVLPGEAARSRFFAVLFAAGMERGGPLGREETEAILKLYQEGADGHGSHG